MKNTQCKTNNGAGGEVVPERWRIHLILKTESALGREALEGLAEYLGPRLDWLCDLISTETARRSPDLGPPKADAALGLIQPATAEHWTAEQKRTVVNVSRGHYYPDIANVTCDDVGIGRMAAEYLLGKKLTSFAYIGHEQDDRERAFAERVSTFDNVYERCFLGAWVDQSELEDFLIELPAQTGILVFNDLLAVQVLRTAEALGLAVPEELAVVGVDNDTVQSILAPVPITSVDPDFHRVGYCAAELLDQILKEGVDARSQTVKIPPRGVVEKGSSDFPGLADPLVLRAARIIRQSACDGLMVRDVVADIPLSRRPLELRFREVFGRTLLQEIHRVRAAEAARLLLQTDLPVTTIAQKTGFNRNDRLNAAFRKHTGESPGAYRRHHRKTGKVAGSR